MTEKPDDILARAANAGITPERVLEEYARIAFANLARLVEWGDEGMQFRKGGDLDKNDLAAISELVESAGKGKPYRVKFYDKKAALDAIARYLGMLPKSSPQESEDANHRGEDPRETLARKLARLAAETEAG